MQPPFAKDPIRRELNPGEELLWQGQPHPAAAARTDTPTLLFAVPWTAFAIFGLRQFLIADEVAGSLIASLFVAVGVYMLTMPWRSYRQAQRTLYAITNQRLLIIETGAPRKITSLRLAGMHRVERLPVRAERTTIRLPMGMVSDGEGGTQKDFIDLHGLSDADRVWKLLTSER